MWKGGDGEEGIGGVTWTWHNVRMFMVDFVAGFKCL